MLHSLNPTSSGMSNAAQGSQMTDGNQDQTVACLAPPVTVDHFIGIADD